MGSSLVIFLGLLLFLCLSTHLEANLQVGFYDSRCNASVESVVRAVVKKAFCKNPGVAAGLLRMHFHDCFVRGCDGSVLIESTSITAEKDSPANNPSLRGFEVIDESKSILEGRCKGVVSCADILAFAARDGVELTKGFGYDVPAGRRDGRISLASEIPGNIPPGTFNLDQLTQNFARKGLTQEEMVTLSGGHSIGRSHCTSVTRRLYNFSSTTRQDPSLDPTYANQLKKQCPEGSTNNNSVVPMDPGSPNVLDSGYYKDILINRGLFTSDQTLISETSTARQVRENAADVNFWRKKFADAMVKMGNIGVLTGNNGEIRLNCRVIN